MHAARFGSEGCVLRLLSHGAARYKKDKAGRMTASDLAIAAGHLHIAGIVSADPKWLDLMEIAAQVCTCCSCVRACVLPALCCPRLLPREH